LVDDSEVRSFPSNPSTVAPELWFWSRTEDLILDQVRGAQLRTGLAGKRSKMAEANTWMNVRAVHEVRLSPVAIDRLDIGSESNK
jgi:hypothetical protein